MMIIGVLQRLLFCTCLGWLFGVPATSQAQAPDALSRIIQRQELVVGVKADYGPWGHYDQTGQLVGFEPDIAKEIADRLGVKLRLVAVTSANRLGKLEDRTVDIVIATMGDTVERRRVADLLQPHYYASGVRLLLPKTSSLTSWSQMRGRAVCMNKGAYYNRHLTEALLLSGQVYEGARDASQALRDGFCTGWAFDDTILAQTLKEPGWEDYHLAMDSIEQTPWTVAVRRGEGALPLGLFVSDVIAIMHQTGWLLALQDKWIGVPSPFLEKKNALWSQTADGVLVCQRAPSGEFPPSCLFDAVVQSGSGAITLPRWVEKLRDTTGIDLGAFWDAYNRGRLLRGLLATVLISVTCILGSLLVGFGMATALVSLAKGGPLSRLLSWILMAFVSITQLTPPILQLYILFFGVAAILQSDFNVTLNAFWIAAFVFSFYAGATNAVLIREELASLIRQNPEARPVSLLPKAALEAYDGLVSTCVNIVKAAGLASTIALFEMIAAVNDMIAEGADTFTLMNFLLLFYLLFVIGVTAVFGTIKRRLT